MVRSNSYYKLLIDDPDIKEEDKDFLRDLYRDELREKAIEKSMTNRKRIVTMLLAILVGFLLATIVRFSIHLDTKITIKQIPTPISQPTNQSKKL